ncbi:UNVERIFIED_CONTAM: hypothetical protein HDU68_004162, partial [Siphonaria sp. JEL0065]
DYSGNQLEITNTGTLASESEYVIILNIVSYSMVAVTVALLLGLVAFALHFEANASSANGGFQIRRALTNFNVTLGLMGICALLLILTDLCIQPRDMFANNTAQ